MSSADRAQIGRRVDADGGLAVDRAPILADAAADAPLVDHHRPAHDGRLAGVRVAHLGVFQHDGLLGQRTHLFADDAVAAIHPGDAAAAVHVRVADDRDALVLQSQGRNGGRGARLAARVATAVAVGGNGDGAAARVGEGETAIGRAGVAATGAAAGVGFAPQPATASAAPAVEARSALLLEMYSLALLLPALNSQVILTPSLPNSSSNQPCFFNTRLLRLYVA